MIQTVILLSRRFLELRHIDDSTCGQVSLLILHHRESNAKCAGILLSLEDVVLE